MEDRLLLSKIDYKNHNINIDGKYYDLNDKNFPTIDIDNPENLIEEEKK